MQNEKTSAAEFLKTIMANQDQFARDLAVNQGGIYDDQPQFWDSKAIALIIETARQLNEGATLEEPLYLHQDANYLNYTISRQLQGAGFDLTTERAYLHEVRPGYQDFISGLGLTSDLRERRAKNERGAFYTVVPAPTFSELWLLLPAGYSSIGHRRSFDLEITKAGDKCLVRYPDKQFGVADIAFASEFPVQAVAIVLMVFVDTNTLPLEQLIQKPATLVPNEHSFVGFSPAPR